MARKLMRVYGAFRGRIERSTFWWSCLLLGAVFAVLFVFLEQTVGRTSTWVLYPPLLWGALALAVKRLHDRGTSAWWLLIAVIPILGPLWLVDHAVAARRQPGRKPVR